MTSAQIKDRAAGSTLVDTTTMTGAEFACGREFLGLPPQWVAAKLGVHIKTIYQWEKSAKVPERAQQLMTLLLRMAEQSVARMTVKWPAGQPIPVPHGRDNSPGTEYPASFHRALASRVAERTNARLIYIGEEESNAVPPQAE
jgi:DNA-binding transcriptional regulator YiaG